MLEQIQYEQYPGELSTGTNLISSAWTCKDWINYFVNLYIKYIEILKKVEESYDQTTHSQMRKLMKKFVENISCRVVQVKKELIFYNNPIIDLPAIPYVFLDDYLIDMKLEYDALEVKIPRYFREDNSEKAVQRRILLDQRLIEKNGDALPEEDFNKFFYKIDMNLEDAIKIIQNVEMGRQNLKRISKSLKLAQKKNENELGGDKKIMMEDERKKLV